MPTQPLPDERSTPVSDPPAGGFSPDPPAVPLPDPNPVALSTTVPEPTAPAQRKPEADPRLGWAEPVAAAPEPRRSPRTTRWVLAVVAVAVVIGYLGYRVVETNPVPGLTGNSLTADDFYDSDSWEVQLGVKQTHAAKIGAWDHEDCADAGSPDLTTLLVDGGCEYGIEGIYARKDLKLTIYQRVFVFPDASAAADAEAAIGEVALHGEVGFHEEVPAAGMYATEIGTSDEYLVVTVAASTAPAPDAATDQTFNYFHSDHLSALLFQ